MNGQTQTAPAAFWNSRQHVAPDFAAYAFEGMRREAAGPILANEEDARRKIRQFQIVRD